MRSLTDTQGRGRVRGKQMPSIDCTLHLSWNVRNYRNIWLTFTIYILMLYRDTLIAVYTHCITYKCIERCYVM